MANTCPDHSDSEPPWMCACARDGLDASRRMVETRDLLIADLRREIQESALGLASELRCKLSEMEPATTNTVDMSKPNGIRTVPVLVDATDATVELADDDQLPGIEPAPKFTKWQEAIAQRALNEKGLC